MSPTQQIINTSDVKYRLVSPDGGWGHLITASVTVMNLVTVVPAAAFGLLYGNFLASTGDPTTPTTLINGTFNTVQSFTGLAANFLLHKYSYRKVGLLGAAIYFIGAFATIFVTHWAEMVIYFGFLQGVGFGLMTPASLTAFNCYFEKRLNLMMSIAQTIMVLSTMMFPPAIAHLLDYFGFRGAVAVLAALALLNFPAMAILQPVKWHMKKVPIQTSTKNNEQVSVVSEKNNRGGQSKSASEEILKAQIEPLLTKQFENDVLTNTFNAITLDRSMTTKFKEDIMTSEHRKSIISIGDRAVSVTLEHSIEETKAASSSMDLSLLKDPKYLNISCGISLCFTSDVAFISIIPMILNNLGFKTKDVTSMIVVYFGSDLVSRILISIVSALYKIRNRYVFLVGAILSAFFRIVFMLEGSYVWKTVTLGILGFLRCLIQTPLTLVITEEYSDNFATAFSLYMVVCGFISLIFGVLMSIVKVVTDSDIIVVHLLTVAYLICCISWTVELIWEKLTSRT